MATTQQRQRGLTSTYRSARQTRRISPEERHALFERAARTYLGMSGDEFIRRYEAGEYDAGDDPNVMNVLILRRFAA